MNIRENVPLHEYTTFKLGGIARYFVDVGTVLELREAVQFAEEKELPIFILGGGSNILVKDSGWNGIVIRIVLKGISMVTDGDSVKITAAAGEVWDDFVAYTVAQGLYGLENLSYIPGTVGAAPVQNIGAYGVEVQSVIELVTAFDTDTKKIVTFTERQCEFAYRDSYFKDPDSSNYIITAVTFRLSKQGKLQLEYKDIIQYYADHPQHPKTLAGVRDAVVSIRTAKLPDWKKLGTAGSFFKNPIITKRDYEELIRKYPLMPSYAVRKNDVKKLGLSPESAVKVPLGWILDHVCNFKGIKENHVGVYDKQSLVLVHFGGGTSAELQDLAERMISKVRETTGIVVEPEVQYVG